jgi:L-threonylcarbamoyladenylate synthase
LLREGKLVAFPTETVYGLGARVSNEEAVRGIFVAKGRPARVPLIVHVGDVDQAKTFLEEMPEAALRWAEAYWPGPLTLVLGRSARVPDAVTAGGSTVGVRVPAHPVALALIEALGDAIAAPSANLYDRLPPVRAEHVMAGLQGRIDAVLDGGRCPGGLESTVVDARVSPAVVLRRGAVAVDRLGSDVREAVVAPKMSEQGWIRVGERGAFDGWKEMAGGKLGRVVWGAPCEGEGVVVREMSAESKAYGEEMYDVLHVLWEQGCTRVWVDAPPKGPAWDSVWDRLARLTSIPRP